MQNSINEILSRQTTYTANFTYADTAVKYNEIVTSQITVNDQLNKTLNVSKHIARREGSLLTIIDLLTGAEEIALNKHEVESIETNLSSEIVSSFTASYMYKEFQDGGIDGTPNLVEKENSVSVQTGFKGGIDKNIGLTMQATGFDVPTQKVVYDTAGLEHILDREKTLNERKPITIVLKDLFDYNIGTKLTFDTDDESGYVVATSVAPSDTNSVMKTTITGIGEYTRKP